MAITEMIGDHMIVRLPKDSLIDVVSDIHGCYYTFLNLIQQHGYKLDGSHPEHRTLVLAGDTINKGKHSEKMFQWIREAEQNGVITLRGNHEERIARRFGSRKCSTGAPRIVQLEDGLPHPETTVVFEKSGLTEDFASWVEQLPFQLIVGAEDNPELFVSHAGSPAANQGDLSAGSLRYCLYGHDAPYNMGGHRSWAERYNSPVTVVHGHFERHNKPEVTNNVHNIDTAGWRDGGLTIYRWPERNWHTTPSHRGDLR